MTSGVVGFVVEGAAGVRTPDGRWLRRHRPWSCAACTTRSAARGQTSCLRSAGCRHDVQTTSKRLKHYKTTHQLQLLHEVVQRRRLGGDDAVLSIDETQQHGELEIAEADDAVMEGVWLLIKVFTSGDVRIAVVMMMVLLYLIMSRGVAVAELVMVRLVFELVVHVVSQCQKSTCR